MKCIRTAPRRQSLWGKDDSITSRETTEIRSNYGIRSELNLPSGYPYDPEKLSIFEKSNLVSVGNSREQVRVTYKIEDEHMREFDRCMRSVATRMLFQNFDAEPEHILILLQVNWLFIHVIISKLLISLSIYRKKLLRLTAFVMLIIFSNGYQLAQHNHLQFDTRGYLEN